MRSLVSPADKAQARKFKTSLLLWREAAGERLLAGMLEERDRPITSPTLQRGPAAAHLHLSLSIPDVSPMLILRRPSAPIFCVSGAKGVPKLWHREK